MISVRSKHISCAKLYIWRPTIQRLDVFPFVVLYPVAIALGYKIFEEVAASLLGIFIVFLLHVLLVLFTHWSVDVHCYVACSKVDAEKISSAQLCKVIPEQFNGSKELCDLRHGEGQIPGSYFEFRKQKFYFSTSDNCFVKMVSRTKECFGKYTRYNGYGSTTQLKEAREKWGENVFEIPLPTFWELFKVQMIAPFFVFQVFCVALWCMDEYWYYSLFTLGMLLVFESTVTQARLRTLGDLRTLSTPMQAVLVHRCGKWERVEGRDLVPGDLISIGRPSTTQGEQFAVPADLLLLAGSCIVNEAVLTGESTPQWKSAIDERDSEDVFNPKKDKQHIISSGTKILQHTPDKSARIRTPEGGCLALVQRTGFATSQGKLMCTIMFSTERVTANNWESGLFISFFLFFAFAAAGYVLKQGLEDDTRSRYKLFLNCTLIVTSVVPPELPMELSIAVNSSLLALSKLGVFCTEPFRIPFAGKVDVCCFDKTGTLTSDEMVFEGVVEECMESANSTPELKLGEELSILTRYVLAACQSLVELEGKVVGDPVERAALDGVGWRQDQPDKVANSPQTSSLSSYLQASSGKGAGGKGPGSKEAPRESLRILCRHHFSSALKRMSVLVQAEEGPNQGAVFALVKGAPEVILEMLERRPAGYLATCHRYSMQGARVLALAGKRVAPSDTQPRQLPRHQLEQGLAFLGFAVFACPVKPESAPTLRALVEAQHKTVMITGDACLTACHVAAQVHITSRPVLILTRTDPPSSTSNLLKLAKEDGAAQWEWVSPEESERVPFVSSDASALAALGEERDLCVGGDGLAMLSARGMMPVTAATVKVFARVAPDQKEGVMKAMRALGLTTLMCGDGTNDVGALKTADVGVALLQASGEQRVPSSRKRRDRVRDITSKSTSRRTRGGAPEAKQELDPSFVPVVRLGDASMASPFTAKAVSVSPCLDILRQGRCTLVTTVQMYKILGLNCLCTAYVLSVQYLDGVKMGDTQATCSGMLTALLFLFLSHAKPLPQLAPQRPHPSIQCVYFLLSVLMQFAVHLTFLVTAVTGAVALMPPDAPKPNVDGDFAPNITNTVSYLVNLHIMVTTFGVNYIGAPFNTPLLQNKPLLATLCVAYATIALVLSGQGQPIEDMLELVSIPAAFRGKLLGMVVADIALAFFIEHGLRFLFPAQSGPKRIAPPLVEVESKKTR